MALEVQGRYIRITLQYQGQRYRFKWPEPATPSSIREAERVQNRIKRDLEDGVFRSIEDYLPNRASHDEFGVQALKWLKAHPASEATKIEYKKALNRFWLPVLGGTPLHTLKPSQIKQIIAETDFPSAKTKNNALIPLRQVLHAARLDGITETDLSEFVVSEKHQTPPPDPLSQSEAEKVIQHFKGKHLGPWWEFMFYTGLRTSEGLALDWASVDLSDKVARIHEAQSKGRSLKKTKTSRVREVLLHDRAMAALEAQRAYTGQTRGKVFLSIEGKPYATEKAHRAAWTPALKELGIRHRPQYNTRHTYATMLLMAGVTPFFVASQLGNSLPVLMRRYAKWIHSDRDRSELAKLKSTDETTDDAM